MAAPAREASRVGGDAPGSGPTVSTALRRASIAVAPVVVFGLLTLGLIEPDRNGTIALTLTLLVAPLAVREVWPIAVLGTVGLGSVITSEAVQTPWIPILSIALASATVGDRVADRVRSFLAVFVVALLMALGFLVQGVDAVAAAVLPFVFVLPTWLVGDLLRSRRIEALRRAEDAAREQRERDERLRAATAEERRHVARELHDVVAHAVSVMVVQAGAARQVVRSSPDAAEQSILAVESVGREAMAELRQFLGALGDEAEGGLAPQPGIAELGDLVERIRGAGLPTTLVVTGDARAVPPSLDVTVYRMVQEGLTNALRHAGRAPTEVRLTWEPDRLRLEILDEGPGGPADPQGSGRGLVGMRDRAALAGGHFEAGPRIGGGFAVRAWLPLESNAA